MENCIFCKIVAGQIPSHKIYENEHVLAFLDISPLTKGHTLVIPKKHVVDVFGMSAEDMAQTFEAVPHIANALKKAFGAVGMNIENNNHEIAGQAVFHYHVHLIPRYGKEDAYEHVRYTTDPKAFTQEILAQIKEEIRREIDAI